MVSFSRSLEPLRSVMGCRYKELISEMLCQVRMKVFFLPDCLGHSIATMSLRISLLKRLLFVLFFFFFLSLFRLLLLVVSVRLLTENTIWGNSVFPTFLCYLRMTHNVLSCLVFHQKVWDALSKKTTSSDESSR